jgi:hypothetical protein
VNLPSTAGAGPAARGLTRRVCGRAPVVLRMTDRRGFEKTDRRGFGFGPKT